MRRTLVAASVALALALPTHAPAHAFLDHASPRVGSSVQRSPPEVRLWFSQELEPAFSTLSVQDAAGKRVDNGDAKVAQDTMQVSLPALAAGRYTVKWRALSVDTHVTEGDFTFEVQP
ncbi:MAG TPA: copper resistance CopC family protein [Casimicrobiaceae bacterium]|nr:copper resistance CopC family protein [Casimicrobiaceae bacterium]